MKSRLKNKGGQVFSIDFIVALTAFFILMGFFFWAWNSIEVKKIESRENSELAIMASQASELLISTQGVPANWHLLPEEEIESIGLLDGIRISSSKIEALENLDSSILKRKLGVLGPSYEVGIDINIFNGTSYSLNSSIGVIPGVNSSKSEKQERLVVYGDYWAQIDVYVSKSKI